MIRISSALKNTHEFNRACISSPDVERRHYDKHRAKCVRCAWRCNNVRNASSVRGADAGKLDIDRPVGDFSDSGACQRRYRRHQQVGNGCALRTTGSCGDKIIHPERSAPHISSRSAPIKTVALSPYASERARIPGLFWLGGFKSDMKGTKAEALDHWAGKEGRACLRFDYSGHGELGGPFTEGTIGRWLEESLAVYLRFAAGRSSSSGRPWEAGWHCCWPELSANKGAAPIAGMVLIAPAVDFTEELMWKQFSDATKREIERKRNMATALRVRRRTLSRSPAVSLKTAEVTYCSAG